MKCPRCRASKWTVEVVIHDGYGVCPVCKTTWQLGPHGEPIALGYDDSADDR